MSWFFRCPRCNEKVAHDEMEKIRWKSECEVCGIEVEQTHKIDIRTQMRTGDSLIHLDSVCPGCATAIEAGVKDAVERIVAERRGGGGKKYDDELFKV